MSDVELASAAAAKGSGRAQDAIVKALYHTYYGAFYAVAALSGHDHWQLDQNEAATLGELTDRALAHMGKGRTTKKVMNLLPFLALGTTLIGIVGVRAQESYAQIGRKKAERAAAARDSAPRAGDRNAPHPGLPGSGPDADGSRNPTSPAGAAIRSLVSEPLS